VFKFKISLILTTIDVKNKRTRFLIGILILMIANIGFSAKAVIIKLMYQYHVSTQSVVALRMLFSVPIFIFVAFVMNRRKENMPLSKKELAAVGGLGILSYYVSSTLDFLGLQYVSAGVERLILFTYPTIVLILSFFIYKKKITPPQYIAVVLTYIGVAIAFVAEKGLGQQTDMIKGGILIGTCAFTYALYVVLTGQLVHRIGSIKFSAYAMIGATVPALIQSYFYDGLDIFSFPKEVYVLTAWMVIAATVIPIFLIVEGIRIVGASNSSIIGFVGPVATIGLAYIFLNDKISALQLLGTGIVLLGVFLISWKGKSGD
jgi:drug/metabolite transporter (DMT)-like permease